MTESYFEHLKHDRRLVILRLLKRSAGHGNDSVLTEGVRLIGHVGATREDVRRDLEFLKERGLVAVDWIDGKVMVARLTERGLDVEAGRVEIDGVKKPSPGGL
jgi:hypothetical protein